MRIILQHCNLGDVPDFSGLIKPHVGRQSA